MLWSINLANFRNYFVEPWLQSMVKMCGPRDFKQLIQPNCPAKTTPPKKRWPTWVSLFSKKTWIGNDPFSHNHGFSVKKWVNSPIVLTFQSQLELWRFLVRNPNLNVPKNLHPFPKFTKSETPRDCFFPISTTDSPSKLPVLETGNWGRFSCRKFLLMATIVDYVLMGYIDYIDYIH